MCPRTVVAPVSTLLVRVISQVHNDLRRLFFLTADFLVDGVEVFEGLILDNASKKSCYWLSDHGEAEGGSRLVLAAR